MSTTAQYDGTVTAKKHLQKLFGKSAIITLDSEPEKAFSATAWKYKNNFKIYFTLFLNPPVQFMYLLQVILWASASFCQCKD